MEKFKKLSCTNFYKSTSCTTNFVRKNSECTKGCKGSCSCKKLGINCSFICKVYTAINCENADVQEKAEEDISEDTDLDLDFYKSNIYS